MQAGAFWQRFIGTIELGDLDDLRRDMILEIGATGIAIGWILTISAIGYDGRIAYLPTALILLAGSILCLWLRTIHQNTALHVQILTLLAAITCFQWFLPDGLAQFFFPLVIVVSSLLVSSRRVFVVALLASAACVMVARLHGAGWLDQLQVTAPVLLILLTAFAAWLGSRQVHMALNWMHTSYRRAERLVEELRDERMAQARSLKALEEAYVRIEKMNYALIEARSTADEARRLKAEFAANVSHELRTPLNIIIGFSETMANAPETYAHVTWSSMLRGDIEQIYQNARHLSALIDDILDLSALEVNRLGLSLEDANIVDVVGEAVGVVKDLYRTKNLYLNVQASPDLPPTRMDPTRIRQVLINLLTNASRFTKEGGVTINARRVENDIQVGVQDTGIGIAPKDVERVFEDFGQVDGSLTRKHEGTGLGVPLSKRLVELHGGRMRLESQLGHGSTFFFTLPVTAGAESGAGGLPAAAPAPAHGFRKPVLMFEPDSLLLRTARRYLSGYDVTGADDPADLAGLIERGAPTALVVDATEAHQPALSRFLEEDLPPDLPVISIAMPGSLRAAQTLQLENYLIKPLLREQLLHAIAYLPRPVREILIVDDDPQLVELISRMLHSTGRDYHPIEAYSGTQALERLREGNGDSRVDLVLLDLVMPEMDGLAVLKEMKADPRLAEIPVIVVSAQYPDMISLEGGLNLRLYRSKNASITEMLSYLHALLNTLPLRGLPNAAGAPASPAGPPAQPAS